jgi:hypothetical protein
MCVNGRTFDGARVYDKRRNMETRRIARWPEVYQFLTMNGHKHVRLRAWLPDSVLLPTVLRFGVASAKILNE